MRVTIEIDSATADEARSLIVAFQRTRDMGLPAQIGTEPTIRMMGIGWGVTTPAMSRSAPSWP